MENEQIREVELFHANRGEDFKNLLSILLRKCCFPKEIIENILTEKNSYFKKYCTIFTHKSVDKQNNYEYYELLGDQSMNKIILYYLKYKFPFLSNNEGIKVLSRLKINLVSKDTYSVWARKLGILPFISCDVEILKKNQSSLLEDTLEAFCGLTEEIADNEIRGNSGMYFISKFIHELLDDTHISLEYSSLYDSITRLKETFDKYNSYNYKGTCPYIHGQISFTHEKLESGMFLVKLCQSSSVHKKEVLLSEEGKSINDIKLELCERYLEFLETKGYKKDILPYYSSIEQLRIKNEMKLNQDIES